MKERLDVLLVGRGLAQSREKAKAIIMSGNVFVKGQREDKAGTMFDENVEIEVKGQTLKYVSRGGLKLSAVAKVKAILWKLAPTPSSPVLKTNWLACPKAIPLT